MARTPQEAERFRDREIRIVETAREIAEQDGWSAVTVRRLSDAIGASQPILYRIFPGGRDEIVARVVVQGYADLADVMRSPGPGDDRSAALRRLITGYLRFAREHPAVYEAMSTAHTSVVFASTETPAALREGFAMLEQAVGGEDARDRAVRAELLWSLLHGASQFAAHDRLDPALDDVREAAIAELFLRG
ncbi:TetR/AcrR family transcriptional regulator [Microbacterium sp. NEAU-LLC]|uniref:TetR/AcrR family transcriptional regulator n=1 Tax=Microbacterium helvum TaxID=2773713 RepID=A0ABR8NRU3_9MICO|nr:TetR/AcrR family transcriptional regulator [Microbacterium helvum]MBD3943268.1 TetR/AcrR family transcriptional regulator [Microbacterium helvum]